MSRGASARPGPGPAPFVPYKYGLSKSYNFAFLSAICWQSLAQFFCSLPQSKRKATTMRKYVRSLAQKATSTKTGKLVLGAGAVLAAASANAQTDATAITTAITNAFTGVAGACITIGTFFVVYRLVKRIK